MNEKSDADLKSKDHRQLIRRQASRLAELLRQSPEYNQFLAAKERLEADDEHATMLSELRHQQMALRMAAMLGEDINDEAGDFESLFVLLSQEPAISDYLFAEGRLLRLISEVEDVFSDKLELWQAGDEDIDFPAYDINLN